MKNKFLAGFTLLELLVVIAIIGILISAGTASFSAAQSKGRNSRRMADLRSVQNALEQYYATNGTYATTGCNVGTTYFPAGLPSDPKNSGIYQYVFTCTSESSYCACAQLEPNGNSYGNADTSSCGGFAAVGTGEFFCVKSLQ